MNQKALICSTVRNVGDDIYSEVYHLDGIFSQAFNEHEYCLIESDSSDSTIMQLHKLKKEMANFNFLSLGQLENKIPSRVERIAYCRNKYLDVLSNYLESGKEIDYLVVVDLDSINNKVQLNEFNYAMDVISQDLNVAGVFPNQLGPYYDIYALRHKYWNAFDSSKVQGFYEEVLGQDVFSAHLSSVLIKMITIPKTANNIEVESAFGGMAIYKAKYASLSRYGSEECEHVSFNKVIRSMNKKLLIVPSFINSGVNNHSIKRSIFYIFYLFLRSKIKKVFNFFSKVR